MMNSNQQFSLNYVKNSTRSSFNISSSSFNSSKVLEQQHVSPELLITIGPQCAGKTTYLSKYSTNLNEKVVDISMDDIDRTYEKISVPMILEYQETGEYDADWERNVYRQSILMRVNEVLCTEQLPLVLLFNEEISLDEFHAHLLTLDKVPEDDRQLIFDTSQKIYEDGHRMMTPTIDLFIRDAMGYSVQQAQQGLGEACRAGHRIVSWGNTNLAPSMYKFALQQAHETNRSVKFIKWGHELPSTSLADLQARNIIRYLRTGRYIHLSVVRDFLRRTELFFSRPEFLESDLSSVDEVLARLAGYQLLHDGKVVPLPPSHGKPENPGRGQVPAASGRGGRGVHFGQGERGHERGGRGDGRGYREGRGGREYMYSSRLSGSSDLRRENPRGSLRSG